MHDVLQLIVIEQYLRNRCVVCFRIKSKVKIQLMGYLLMAKVYTSKLFLNTGYFVYSPAYDHQSFYWKTNKVKIKL